jgi:hypothetical protein
MTEPFRYTIPSLETLYNGTRFRSELEASWAAFFDLRGIVAEYEPAVAFQCWRPHYAIALVGEADSPFAKFAFAEVKPYHSQDQWGKDLTTLSNITRALRGTSAILLGSSAILPSSFMFRMEEEQFEPITFGPSEDVTSDWKKARNMVEC